MKNKCYRYTGPLKGCSITGINHMEEIMGVKVATAQHTIDPGQG